MESSLIIYKSISVANRAKRILEKENIKGAIVQAPQSVRLSGCNYALKVKKEELKRAVEISLSNSLKIESTAEVEF